MIDLVGLDRITDTINDFAEGSPQSEEFYVAEGVYFSLDCPFEEDLMESVIPIAIGIESWSPLNEGKPTRELLCDYSDEMDTLSSELEIALHNGGSRDEEILMEYVPDLGNTGNNTYIFLGSIDNPRINVTMDGIEVREEYA